MNAARTEAAIARAAAWRASSLFTLPAAQIASEIVPAGAAGQDVVVSAAVDIVMPGKPAQMSFPAAPVISSSPLPPSIVLFPESPSSADPMKPTSSLASAGRFASSFGSDDRLMVV